MFVVQVWLHLNENNIFVDNYEAAPGLFGSNVTKESGTIFSVFDKYRNLYCYLLDCTMKRIHSFSVVHNLEKKTLHSTEKSFLFCFSEKH